MPGDTANVALALLLEDFSIAQVRDLLKTPGYQRISACWLTHCDSNRKLAMHVDAATFKSYKDITTSGEDALIATLLGQAQKMVETFTGRVFEVTANTTRTFDAEKDVDGHLLYFDRDLYSINTVTNGDGVLVAASEYVTEPRNGPPYYAIRLKGSSTVAWTFSTDAENAIIVSGKWAYSLAAPDDVVWATLRLTSYLYEQRKNAGDLDRPVYVGAMLMMPTRMPKDVADMLVHYVRSAG